MWSISYKPYPYLLKDDRRYESIFHIHFIPVPISFISINQSIKMVLNFRSSSIQFIIAQYILINLRIANYFSLTIMMIIRYAYLWSYLYVWLL